MILNHIRNAMRGNKPINEGNNQQTGLLLVEETTARIQNEGKNCYIEGVVCRGNQPTKNNRLYPTKVLEESIGNISDQVKSRNFFWELGHSPEGNVNAHRISHIVESLTRKNDDWYARSRVINEGSGKILKAIVEAKGAIG